MAPQNATADLENTQEPHQLHIFLHPNNSTHQAVMAAKRGTHRGSEQHEDDTAAKKRVKTRLRVCRDLPVASPIFSLQHLCRRSLN